MDELIIGQNVRYVTIDGVHLFAFIVKIRDRAAGTVSLTVLNGLDEFASYDALSFSILTASYDKTMAPNTWHWVERA